jgi:3-hydroxyisobutyrate dehydrogenase-like beta-hydroxyacid dehydrogenase
LQQKGFIEMSDLAPSEYEPLSSAVQAKGGEFLAVNVKGLIDQIIMKTAPIEVCGNFEFFERVKNCFKCFGEQCDFKYVPATLTRNL